MAFEYASFIGAHKRYQGYRDAAFHSAWECVSVEQPEVDIRLMPIDGDALDFWRLIDSVDLLFPDGGFRWDKIYDFIRPNPRRFDIAVWSGSLLCGMAAGQASRRGENVTVRWIERFAIPHNPLAGTLAHIAFTAAGEYAKILGCQCLLLKNPHPGTRRHYEKLGFSLAPNRFGATYYRRNL